ncbi:hypothetical protein [Microlunatus sp. GCM10028923]|uniref:hypothetical protein n=1 Tax=Microlunatus sp. GCM10028923 TaxID=3273400 RepID=UPI00360CDE11
MEIWNGPRRAAVVGAALVMIIVGAAACAPPGPAPADPPTAGGSASPSSAPTATPTPAPPPPAGAGTSCGPIGRGQVALVARGEAECATVVAIMKKFVGMDDIGIGQTIKVGGWGCAVLDGSSGRYTTIYTLASECSSGKKLIKAWPADSPVPAGSQVDVKHYAGTFSDGGYPYHFSSSGGGFTCGIRPPSDKGPGHVGCHGTLPKDAKGEAPGGGSVAANTVVLTRDRKARFVFSGDPAYLRTEGSGFAPAKRLPVGQVLAFYGVACSTGPKDSVRCVNGKHAFTVRPGQAELS